MQVKHHDGSFGPIEPYTLDNLEKAMSNPNVEHVEVFNATPEQLEWRKKNLGVRNRSIKQSKKRK